MSDKQVQKRETKRSIVPPPKTPVAHEVADHSHQMEDKIKAAAGRTQEILTKDRKVENMLHQGR